MTTTAVEIGSHLDARASSKWACVYTLCYYILSNDRECVQYQWRVAVGPNAKWELWVWNEKARRDERHQGKQPVCKLRIYSFIKPVGTFNESFIILVMSSFRHKHIFYNILFHFILTHPEWITMTMRVQKNYIPGPPNVHAAITKEVKGQIYFLDSIPRGREIV